jgi:hypothetical protein
MRNQKKWLVGIIVILVLMNVTMLAFFWMGPKGRPAPKKITNHFVKELNLSAAQKTIFEKSSETHLQSTKITMDSIKAQKETMLKMLVEKDKSLDKLNQIIEKIGNLEAKRDKNLVSHYIELEEACESEEQRENLRQIFKKSIPRHKHKHK